MNEPHIPASLRRKLAEEGRHRCGYCLTTEALLPDHGSQYRDPNDC
jgi:hypothetical protein